MERKYLTSIDELLSFNNTGRKIYQDGFTGYYYLINDNKICRYNRYGSLDAFNLGITESQVNTLYIGTDIDIPSAKDEAKEKDEGKLCKFWNGAPEVFAYGILSNVNFDNIHLEIENKFCEVRPYEINNQDIYYEHAKVLSFAEFYKLQCETYNTNNYNYDEDDEDE